MSCCGFENNANTSTGVSQGFNIISGSYMTPLTCSPNAAGVVITANLLYLFPYRMSLRAASLASEVTVGIAASNLRMGIYSCDSDGRPDALIEDSGNISSAAAAVKTYNFAAGVRNIQQPIWFGVVYSAAVTVRSATSSSVVSNNMIGNTTLASANNGGVTTPLAFGALPADLTGSPYTYVLAASGPIVALVTA